METLAAVNIRQVGATAPRDSVAVSSCIAEYNIRMAKETENLDLDPDTIHRGVRAIIEEDRSGTGRGKYFVAELDGRIIGQLMITYEWSDWTNADVWWIQSVYVVPEHRGKGVFKKLYTHVRAKAEEHKACGLRLYADNDNIKAQDTYKRLGMTTHYAVFEDMWA